MNKASRISLALMWLSWIATASSSCETSSPRVTPPWFLKYIPDSRYSYPSAKRKEPQGAVEANHDVIRRVYEKHFEEQIKGKLDCEPCNMIDVRDNEVKWEVQIKMLIRSVVKAVLEEGDNVEAKVHCPHPSNCMNLSDKEYCGCQPLYLAVKWGEPELVKSALERGADLNITCGHDTRLLMVANNWDVINLLIENGADIHTWNKYGENLLHEWARRKMISGTESMEDVLRKLLMEGIDVNKRNSAGDTALLISAYKQPEKWDYSYYPVYPDALWDSINILARGLLKYGADVDVRNSRSWTPLHIATRNCNLGLVKMLLEAGADIDTSTDDGETPFLIAVNQHIEHATSSVHLFFPLFSGPNCKKFSMLRLLTGAGANLDVKKKNNRTALHLAVLYSDFELAELLVDSGASVDPEDVSAGQTPLHHAVLSSRDDISALLIKRGANINAKQKQGLTPLHIAVFFLGMETARMLIQNGADVNSEDALGHTPLHYAVGSPVELMELLFEWSQNKNARDMSGRTPLDYAQWHLYEVTCRSKNITSLLINSGANVNAKDASGRAPLHYAVHAFALCSESSKDISALLINSDANVNAKDVSGWAPLHYAVKISKDTSALLIESGANVNAKQNNGWTPLHVAVFCQSMETVKLLIQNGAYVNDKQKQGWTPWMMANRLDQVEIAELLVENGAETSVLSRIHSAMRWWCQSVGDFLELISSSKSIDLEDMWDGHGYSVHHLQSDWLMCSADYSSELFDN